MRLNSNGCKPPMETPRIIEQSRISPASGQPLSASLPLSFFDIIWYPAGPVRRLFFYDFPHPTATILDSVVPRLKSSLSLALRHFFPLAGNLCCTSLDHSEITCTDVDSICFIVAEDGANFSELSSGRARSLPALRRLVPQLNWSGAAQPLMAAQVTVFPGQGFVVGTTVHHVACDGASSIHFMKSWASGSRMGRFAEALPVFDRSTIANPLGLRSVNIYPGSDSASAEESTSDVMSDFRCAAFSIVGAQLQRLKSSVMAKTTRHCSTVVVTYAYTWVCLAKTLGYAGDDLVHLIFPADYRARLEPATPATYFGNCIVPCFAELKAGQLMREEGIIVASEAIGKAIEDMREGNYLAGAQEWGRKWQAAAATQPMSVAGSPKFRVYDTDFGWGRPVKVELVIERSGAISLAETRDGDGVEIGLGFNSAVMELFERHFSDGLKLVE